MYQSRLQRLTIDRVWPVCQRGEPHTPDTWLTAVNSRHQLAAGPKPGRKLHFRLLGSWGSSTLFPWESSTPNG